MGFQLDQAVQLSESAPAIAARMREEGAYGVVLVPV
jgi:hypothetical protein